MTGRLHFLDILARSLRSKLRCLKCRSHRCYMAEIATVGRVSLEVIANMRLDLSDIDYRDPFAQRRNKSARSRVVRRRASLASVLLRNE